MTEEHKDQVKRPDFTNTTPTTNNSPGQLFQLDAQNNRFMKDQPSQDGPTRIKLRAIKALNSTELLFHFIQRLFEEKKVSEADRDILIIWSENFARKSSIDEKTIYEVQEEIKDSGLLLVVKAEVAAWKRMSWREAKKWGDTNLPDYYNKLLEDYPVNHHRITILFDEQKEEINDQLDNTLNEVIINFWHYLVICFRIARLANKAKEDGKKTFSLKTFLLSFF